MSQTGPLFTESSCCFFGTDGSVKSVDEAAVWLVLSWRGNSRGGSVMLPPPARWTPRGEGQRLRRRVRSWGFSSEREAARRYPPAGRATLGYNCWAAGKGSPLMADRGSCATLFVRFESRERKKCHVSRG